MLRLWVGIAPTHAGSRDLLVLDFYKTWLGAKGLVNMSACREWVGREVPNFEASVTIFPHECQRCSSSMCLVRLCMTGLRTRWVLWILTQSRTLPSNLEGPSEVGAIILQLLVERDTQPPSSVEDKAIVGGSVVDQANGADPNLYKNAWGGLSGVDFCCPVSIRKYT